MRNLHGRARAVKSCYDMLNLIFMRARSDRRAVRFAHNGPKEMTRKSRSGVYRARRLIFSRTNSDYITETRENSVLSLM